MHHPKTPGTLALIALLFLTACGHANAPAATATRTVPPLSAERGGATVTTPQPPRDVVLTFRAVQRALHTDDECAALGTRAHVSTVAAEIQGYLGAGVMCWREVPAGDSAYARAATLRVLLPKVTGRPGSVSFKGTATTKSADACIALARAGHHAAIAVVPPRASPRYASCVEARAGSQDSSYDDGAGTSATYTVRASDAAAR